jgi:Flp pilus assembly pilin Flp
MKFRQDERGQGLTEYAFLLSLVVLVVIVVVFFFGVSVEDLYNNFVTTLVDVFT